MKHPNPFFAGRYGGHETFHLVVEDRLSCVERFDADECRRALAVVGLQKTVRVAIERRLRKHIRGQ